MIDSNARKVALDVLNKIDKENLTNWQLEDSWPSSEKDPAINCILRWIWTQYDDGKEVVLKKAISLNAYKIIERCRKYLATEIEFPILSLTLEEERKIRKEWGKEWRCDCTLPENDNWPFPDNS